MKSGRTGFRTWLRRRREGEGETAAFIRAARSDPRFPDARRFEEVENYVRPRAGWEAEEVVDAARRVWQEFDGSSRQPTASK